MSEQEKKDAYIKAAMAFINDVLPQVGKLCIQDYANLNNLLILEREIKAVMS